MNPVDGLIYGLHVLLQPQNLVAVFAGSFLGTMIGVLPGIGPLGAMAILISVSSTFAAPETGLIMLGAIYYGAMYGGSTTAILLRVPGEVASIVTCIDGYEMARKGRAGAALAVTAIGSFVAGTVGVVVLMLIAPPLANYALAFGPPEYFALMLVGLVALSSISGGPVWRSLLMVCFGLGLANVGMDMLSGFNRYTFGIVELTGGISFAPVIMGLYGLSEMMFIAERVAGGGEPRPEVVKVRFRDLFPTKEEWRRSINPILRGSGIGFLLGLLPGPSPMLSTFISYRTEQTLSKHPEEFGHGAIEGVAGPESANNAASTAAFVPLLALGLPFGAAAAMLLTALIIRGVPPGPLLVTQHPDIFWGVVASMYIGNLILLILNLPLVGLWVSLLRVPEALIVAAVTVFLVVGSYAVANSILDVGVMITMGVVGYFLRKLKFELSPIVLAMVLGPLVENALRQSLSMSRGSVMIFAERPIAASIFAVAIVVLIGRRLLRLRAAGSPSRWFARAQR